MVSKVVNQIYSLRLSVSQFADQSASSCASIYSHTRTHTHIYIYIHVCVCVCLSKPMLLSDFYMVLMSIMYQEITLNSSFFKSKGDNLILFFQKLVDRFSNYSNHKAVSIYLLVPLRHAIIGGLSGEVVKMPCWNDRQIHGRMNSANGMRLSKVEKERERKQKEAREMKKLFCRRLLKLSFTRWRKKQKLGNGKWVLAKRF